VANIGATNYIKKKKHTTGLQSIGRPQHDDGGRLENQTVTNK
jgi:hypothetical protein